MSPGAEIVEKSDVLDVELLGKHGGVYVAGGIAVKILEKMKDGAFFKSFRDKWHFENLLKNIPVSVILNENAPQLGAGYEALRLVQK